MEEVVEVATPVLDAISSSTFGVWFLIGAALVFWMQADLLVLKTPVTSL